MHKLKGVGRGSEELKPARVLRHYAHLLRIGFGVCFFFFFTGNVTVPRLSFTAVVKHRVAF